MARLSMLARSSSLRLAALHALIFAIAVSALFALIYVKTLESVRTEVNDLMAAELARVVDAAARGGVPAVQRFIDQHTGRGAVPGELFLLQDQEGRRIAGTLPTMTARDGWRNLPPRYDANDHRYRDKSHVVRVNGHTLPDGSFVAVGYDTHPVNELREIMIRAFTACLTVTITLALASGVMMGLAVIRRVRAINVATRQIMLDDLSRRIPIIGRGDEFDELAGYLNVMLDRIQSLLENLRQVSNDIAHDLRTPLSRLRQRLEEVLLWRDDLPERRDQLEMAIADVDRILATFTSLLRIAQIEAGTRKAGFQDVDLSSLLDELIDSYALVAEDTGHHLGGRIAPAVSLRGDHELLTQLFANLLGNALKHTPAGSHITVGLAADAAAIVATVADDGPGIPPEMRGRVLERFVRLESSRTTPGSGLGLSLVLAIAQLHDAHLDLADNAPGLRVSIVWPRAAGA